MGYPVLVALYENWNRQKVSASQPFSISSFLAVPLESTEVPRSLPPGALGSLQATRTGRCLHCIEWADFLRWVCRAPRIGWYLENLNESSKHLTSTICKRFFTVLTPRTGDLLAVIYISRVCLPIGSVPTQEECWPIKACPGVAAMMPRSRHGMTKAVSGTRVLSCLGVCFSHQIF